MDWTLFPVFALAVLAAWLGLSLVVRNPRDGVTRAFGWLSLHLTIYALMTALAPLTASAQVARGALAVQALESVVLPPVFLDFILAVRAPQHRRRWQRVVLWAFYVVGALMAAYALFGPGMIQERAILRFPPGLLAWLWVAQRALPLLLALALMLAS
ncbi:MAG TPA: hypothetical protein VFT99_13815, partial [Roseiflexaceae bacterium]|nr:hypothetical protein [Roseiflexaceae bacterium]